MSKAWDSQVKQYGVYTDGFLHLETDDKAVAEKWLKDALRSGYYMHVEILEKETTQ